MKFPVASLASLSALHVVASVRILGFFPVPSISHQQVYRNFMYELSRRGHQVTTVSPNPLGIASENHTEIDIGFAYSSLQNWNENFFRLSPAVFMWRIFRLFNYIIDQELSHESVQKLLREGSFDLVIVEYLMFPSVFALSAHFNAPYIGISSLDISPTSHSIIGHPYNPAYYTDMMQPVGNSKNFCERMIGTLYYLYWTALYHWYQIPAHDAISKKHFGPNTPHIRDIEKNVSMVFAYTDLKTMHQFPTVPAYVPIGGGNLIHLPQRKQLPTDIQEFLDGAEHGVLYFSLGSNVKSRDMPERKRRIFIDAFRRLKQKVLWKWEDDDLEGKPDNVKIHKWLPQTDVLAHPNVRAFVTQGGLQSISEAIFFRVPMVVIPFFADQELNAKKMVLENVAVKVDYDTIDTSTFLAAVNDVTDNPRYKENVIRYSALTQDQPDNPMDRAVWWTEYVIRHKGAPHLRSPAIDMPWYQYFLLDVFAFLFLILAASLFILYFIGKCLLRMVFKRRKPKKD